MYYSTQAQFIVNNGLEIHNSGLIATNGDWSNASGTIIVNDGIISTSAGFVNNGTLDPAGKGGFELNVNADFNFAFGGPQINFLKKTGSGAAILMGTLHIKDSLDLTQGAIRIQNSNDTLALLNEGKLINTTGFVEGLFARSGKGDLIFPVGKDGTVLPIKLYKVQAKKVTASVFNTPAGFSAGPGVDALIGFPYSWKVQEATLQDTAAYVEINYPDTLSVVANPVVVRESPALQFTNMGARYIDNSGGRVTVRSYSRRLNGVFSIAQGFASDPKTDSLALVALYDATDGSNWTNNQWKSGDIDTWPGVITAGPTITGLLLSNNNLSGPIPDVVTDIQSLDTIMLAGNNITFLPDFSSNSEIILLDVSDNDLDFSSLEPNADVPGFAFANQGRFGVATDSLIEVGSDITITVSAGGDSTEYQWKYNGEVIADANNDSLTVTSVNRVNMGDYYLEATNPKLPGLTLVSEAQSVKAYASISGQLKIDSANVATAGTVTLLKVQTNAFENTGAVHVNENGEYLFDKVVLDDYQVLGFADTSVYADALPTYYDNKLFWEEADTVFLNDHRPGLDIVSIKKPGESPVGIGVINGTLEEEITTSGRVDKTLVNKRVENAGVSARRVERSGRGKLTNLVLVSYVFTNENGAFNITELPEGEYRLNIQYPGYPMDTTSDVTLTIGGPLESVVAVEAKVLDGKINVRKLTVTGINPAEHYDVELFPNPAVETIHLNFGYEKRNRSVELVGMTGQRFAKQPAETTKSIIPVNSFQKGIYILRVKENGKMVKSFKVVID